MKSRLCFAVRALVVTTALALSATTAAAQATQTPPDTFKPTVGQEGKDVVWVPTPDALVAKMLDMAGVTPDDHVIDLGSGDGRTVIAAAKRGATAVGIEYNPDMVALAKRNAEAAGVAGKATFMKADLFQTDLSKAQVITMFLLPSINMKLRPKLLDLQPGTRIVSNSFTMEDWKEDEVAEIEDGCTNWCTAYLWIVPAKVNGAWQLDGETLMLTQVFQEFTGMLGSAQVADGRLHGADISFTVGGTAYKGTVDGDTIRGTKGNGESFTATRP